MPDTVRKKDGNGPYEIYRPSRFIASPEISVVMSVYNGEKYLTRCLESILQQTFESIEFILINDGSTDNSLGIIQSYAQHDKRICFLNQQNIGLTKSLNRGLKLARGRCIARQDVDDISLPHRFEKQLFHIRNGYDFVCCRSIFNNKNVTPFIFTIFYRVLIKHINVFVHGTYFFKKEIIERIGFYNEEFIYAQDYEFIRRIIRNRFSVCYMRDILYRSNQDDQSITKSKLSLQKKSAQMIRKSF